MLGMDTNDYTEKAWTPRRRAERRRSPSVVAEILKVVAVGTSEVHSSGTVEALKAMTPQTPGGIHQRRVVAKNKIDSTWISRTSGDGSLMSQDSVKVWASTQCPCEKAHSIEAGISA